MTDRELLQQALDALNKFDSGKRNHGMLWQVPVIEAIKARLAQPEPVNKFNPDWDELEACRECLREYMEEIKKLKKEWVGLTEEEYEAMAEQYVTNCYFDTLEYAKAIEIKLKDKNEKR